MKTQIAKCIKNYKDEDFKLVKDKEYDVKLHDDGKFTVFTRVWATLYDGWEEYLTII